MSRSSPTTSADFEVFRVLLREMQTKVSFYLCLYRDGAGQPVSPTQCTPAFRHIADCLLDDIVACGMRLLDPPATGSRQNLSIYAMIQSEIEPSGQSLAATLRSDLDEVREMLVDYCNKRLAHNDRDVLVNGKTVGPVFVEMVTHRMPFAIFTVFQKITGESFFYTSRKDRLSDRDPAVWAAELRSRVMR